MGFFESVGNIRADLQMPLFQRRLQSRYDLENKQIEDALNQAMTLKQQQGKEGFNDPDKLRYNQLLQRAGINPAQIAQADKFRAETEQAALRNRGLQESIENIKNPYAVANIANKLDVSRIPAQMAQAEKFSAEAEQVALRNRELQEALEQIDNPYAAANIANKLDVSPIRMVGQNVYNRFDTDNWLVGTTPKGQSEAQSAFNDASKKNVELEVLQDVLKDENMPFSKKLDYLSGKEISDTERIEVVDKDGKKVHATRYWTPSGYKIKKDTDTEGSYVSILANETTYANQRNIEDLKNAGFDKSEAARIVLAKDRSNLAIYEDINKSLRAGSQYDPPMTDEFQLKVESIKTYAGRRPGQQLPRGLKQSLKLHKFTEEQEKELLSLIDNINNIADLVSTNSQVQAEGIKQEMAEEAEAIEQQKKLEESLPSQDMIAQQGLSESIPAQQLKPLTPEVMDAAYQAFLQEVPPEAIRKRLEDSGFDMSPETIAVMAIDAINQNADPEQVAERFKAMGYDLKALGL